MSIDPDELAIFRARVDQWIEWEWPCVTRDRASLLLVGSLADDIHDEGDDEGPGWRFVITYPDVLGGQPCVTTTDFDWYSEDGFDAPNQLLNVLAALLPPR